MSPWWRARAADLLRRAPGTHGFQRCVCHTRSMATRARGRATSRAVRCACTMDVHTHGNPAPPPVRRRHSPRGCRRVHPRVETPACTNRHVRMWCQQTNTTLSGTTTGRPRLTSTTGLMTSRGGAPGPCTYTCMRTHARTHARTCARLPHTRAPPSFITQTHACVRECVHVGVHMHWCWRRGHKSRRTYVSACARDFASVAPSACEPPSVRTRNRAARTR